MHLAVATATDRPGLRAVLRASAHGPIRIMFPLVSTVMELRQARMILSDVMDECEEEGISFNHDIPVGIMIEVPSAPCWHRRLHGRWISSQSEPTT